jgi:hypothetical protein
MMVQMRLRYINLEPIMARQTGSLENKIMTKRYEEPTPSKLFGLKNHNRKFF